MKIENSVHTPVLVKEVLEYLNIRPESKVIDATLDGGGHPGAILEAQPKAQVLGIEWDPALFREVSTKLEGLPNLVLVNDSYINMKDVAEKKGFMPDGILFDLGLSSWHYEHSGRGFSFSRDEYLDMRFNPESGEPDASRLINTLGRAELEEIIQTYGEEQFFRQIAGQIAESRKSKPIITTEELVQVIGRAVPEWYKHKKIHFATKTFQALRVAVNHELENIEKGLEEAKNILKPGGRMVVISFQGLEDKLVKNVFRRFAKEGTMKLAVKGTIRPSWEEIKANPRARSAKMKVAEKI